MSSLSQDVTVTPSISGSFSASAFSPPSTFATPIPSSAGDDNDNGMPAISRSSSLLFGFLITFLALFIGFMACGYSSRRAAQIRGARFVAQSGGIGNYDFSRLKKPLLWDVWIAEGPGRGQWKDLTPLSASIVHPNKKRSMPNAQENISTASLRRARDAYLADFISFHTIGSSRSLGRQSGYSFPRPPQNRPQTQRSTRTISEPTDSSDPHAQISVLIAMPSPASQSASAVGNPGAKSICDEEDRIIEENRECQPLGVYEVGVARVPIPGCGRVSPR